jgi:hypothetical protein
MAANRSYLVPTRKGSAFLLSPRTCTVEEGEEEGRAKGPQREKDLDVGLPRLWRVRRWRAPVPTTNPHDHRGRTHRRTCLYHSLIELKLERWVRSNRNSTCWQREGHTRVAVRWSAGVAVDN